MSKSKHTKRGKQPAKIWKKNKNARVLRERKKMKDERIRHKAEMREEDMKERGMVSLGELMKRKIKEKKDDG
jgi:hypothetical protein